MMARAFEVLNWEILIDTNKHSTARDKRDRPWPHFKVLKETWKKRTQVTMDEPEQGSYHEYPLIQEQAQEQ